MRELLQSRGQAIVVRFGNQFAPVRTRPDPRHIGHLQREHAAQTYLLIGGENRLEIVGMVGDQRAHVLDRRDSSAEAFDGSREGPGAQFVAAPSGVRRWQGIGGPQLERNGLETPLEQHVMRVIVRVEEAGQDEPVPGIDDPHAHSGGVAAIGAQSAAYVRPDLGDAVTFDQDIGDARGVGVSRVLEDAAAFDQDRPVLTVHHALP